jgi:hypothetical protein
MEIPSPTGGVFGLQTDSGRQPANASNGEWLRALIDAGYIEIFPGPTTIPVTFDEFHRTKPNRDHSSLHALAISLKNDSMSDSVMGFGGCGESERTCSISKETCTFGSVVLPH